MLLLLLILLLLLLSVLLLVIVTVGAHLPRKALVAPFRTHELQLRLHRRAQRSGAGLRLPSTDQKIKIVTNTRKKNGTEASGKI